MRRTAARPLPSGRLNAWQAVTFGLALNAIAALVLWWLANPAAAVLALLGTAYYVGVYTMTARIDLSPAATALNMAVRSAQLHRP